MGRTGHGLAWRNKYGMDLAWAGVLMGRILHGMEGARNSVGNRPWGFVLIFTLTRNEFYVHS